MEIIKLANGEKRYREIVYIDGKKINSPSFRRKADAKSWKSEMISKRDKAKIYGEKIIFRKKESFVPFVTSWLEESVKKRHTYNTYLEYRRTVEKKLIPVIGDKNMDDISYKDAEKIVALLVSRGHTNKVVNNNIGVLKTLLRHAQRLSVINNNPLTDFPQLKVNMKAHSYWTDSEINTFLVSCTGDELYPLYVLALNTGLRRGELCGLKWDRVDFSRKLIIVSRTRDTHGLRERTKSARDRFVPMNDVCVALLRKLYNERKSDYVLTKASGDLIGVHHIYRKFAKSQKLSGGLTKIRFHDLRHTFASQFMMKGGNIYDLQKILGHADLSMTQRYAHLSPEHLANTTSILSFDPGFKSITPYSPHGDVDREKSNLVCI